MLLPCVLLVLALIALPTLMTVLLERSNRAAWGIVTEGYDGAGEGAYRGARVARRAVGRAPSSVVAGAWTAFFLGQMVVPGGITLVLSALLLTALESMRTPTFLVFVAAAPTGLLLAGRQLATGRALLMRRFAAETTTRRTAKFAFIQCFFLVAAIIPAAVIEGDGNATELATLVVVGTILTVAQAFLLLRAARDLERHADREYLPEAETPA